MRKRACNAAGPRAHWRPVRGGVCHTTLSLCGAGALTHDGNFRAGCQSEQAGYIVGIPFSGGVAEWLKAHAWKACIRETVSWVRIPLPPPAVLAAAIDSLPWQVTRVVLFESQPSRIRAFGPGFVCCETAIRPELGVNWT